MVCAQFNAVNAEPFQNGAKSLKGFSPMYGGMDDTLKNLEKVTIAGYSDNVYYFDKATRTLFSMDVEKMESTSTPLEAVNVMKVIIDCVGIPETSYLGQFIIYMEVYSAIMWWAFSTSTLWKSRV